MEYNKRLEKLSRYGYQPYHYLLKQEALMRLCAKQVQDQALFYRTSVHPEATLNHEASDIC